MTHFPSSVASSKTTETSNSGSEISFGSIAYTVLTRMNGVIKNALAESDRLDEKDLEVLLSRVTVFKEDVLPLVNRHIQFDISKDKEAKVTETFLKEHKNQNFMIITDNTNLHSEEIGRIDPKDPPRGVKVVYYKAMTVQEETEMVNLHKEQVSLLVQKLIIEIWKETKERRENRENLRFLVGKTLDLAFSNQDGLFTRTLSYQDAEKLEFDAKSKKFLINEQTLNDVIVKFIKNHQLSSLNLKYFGQIPEGVVLKLFEHVPTTTLRNIVMSRDLTEKERRAAAVAKKSIPSLQLFG